MNPNLDLVFLEDSLDESLRAGDAHAAAESLAVAWPAISALHGAELRRLIARVPEEAWNHDPRMLTAMGASYRSLRSESRSAALPWFTTAETVLSHPSPSEQSQSGPSHPTAATVSAVRRHHAAALRSLGQLDAARVLAEEAWAVLDRDTALAASVRVRHQARCALELGLLRLHLGDADGSMAMLHTALGLAEGNLVQSEFVECLSGLCLLGYLSGDVLAARYFGERAAEESADTGLLDSQFGAASLIAATLSAVDKNSVVEALALTSRLERAAHRSDWEPLAHYAHGFVSVIDGSPIEGLDHVRRGMKSLRTWTGHPVVGPMLATLRGMLLMRVGEFAAAATALVSIAPTPDHSVCPGRIIAGIRYKAGDSSGCLDTLRDCELVGEAHATRTLIDVLVLKSAASYDLDEQASADVALDRALLLAAESSLTTPFLLMPTVALQRMLARAADRKQAPIVHRLLDTLKERHEAPSGGSLEPLSDRERDVARHLFNDQTVREIAAELFISTNTVKSHIRSIYRKLAANNREDAVRRVQELGVDLTVAGR